MDEEKIAQENLSLSRYINAVDDLSTAVNTIAVDLMNFEFSKISAAEMSRFLVIINNLHKVNEGLNTLSASLKTNTVLGGQSDGRK